MCRSIIHGTTIVFLGLTLCTVCSLLARRHRDPATLALLDEEEAAEQHALEVLLDEDAREVRGQAAYMCTQGVFMGYATCAYPVYPIGRAALHKQSANLINAGNTV